MIALGFRMRYSLTNSWDSSWQFSTRPKTAYFGFGPKFTKLLWPGYSVVAVDPAPKYLSITLPFPTFLDMASLPPPWRIVILFWIGSSLLGRLPL